MLSQQFQQETARRATQSAATQQARAARDAFIVVQWPLLDAAFAALVDSAVGTEAHLSITHTPATDNFTNHTFASLNKTITAVQSTLNGAPETVTFTPALESIDPDQFGVIRITTDGLPYSITTDPGAQVFADMLKRGILMRGKTTSSLVAPDGSNFMTLNAELVEGLLAALFIRD
ncbi:MAG: hypothetical protein LAP21_16005 [Acidobacteriia bacterium]|nr:hypothetical protein [Terriglobia bacterium]